MHIISFKISMLNVVRAFRLIKLHIKFMDLSKFSNEWEYFVLFIIFNLFIFHMNIVATSVISL